MINEDNNSVLYRYVKVVYDANTAFEYSYLDEQGVASVGDYVWVPVGKFNEKKIAYVVKAGEYTADRVPYPLEKTKKILRLATDEELAKIEADW